MAIHGPDRFFDDLSLRWRDLAERRRDHLVELYESGRWKHYYTEDRFRARMREAVAAVEAWTRIAGISPSPAAEDSGYPAHRIAAE